MQRRAILAALPMLLIGASVVAAPTPAEAARIAVPADPRAGGSATTLLRNLSATQDPGQLDGFLFGQQHANWDSKRYRSVDEIGVDWRGPRVPIADFDRFVSDIELATTLLPGVEPSRPAVYGFSMRTALRLGQEEQIAYADRIVAAYSSGGVVTMHFPADNPVTGSDHRDVSANALCMLSTDWSDPADEAAGAVATWQSQLDEAGDFFHLVNTRWRDPDSDGVDERSGRVAMVFRPFHEMLRVTHWWSAAHYRNVPDVCEGSAASAFRSVWRQTFDYLVGADGLDVHGLLFAWSPDRPTSFSGWQTFYPNVGLESDPTADYVDVIAFDIYEDSPEAFSAQLVADASAVTAFNQSLPAAAREIVAIGEFGPASGLSTVPEGNWFMQSVIRPLTEAGLADDIAYAMTWSNFDEEHYWVPLPCFNVPECEAYEVGDSYYSSSGGVAGDPLRGFRAFVNHPATVFLDDLPAWWRMPNTTIPFQPGDSPPLIMRIPCWQRSNPLLPDVVQRLDSCPLPTAVGRATGLRR